MSAPHVLAPDVWADLLADAAATAHAEMTAASTRAESYRACFLAALRLLRQEQQAHAATRRRYQELLAERRTVQQPNGTREAAA